MDSTAGPLSEPDMWEIDPRFWQWIKRIGFLTVVVLTVVFVAGVLLNHFGSRWLGVFPLPLNIFVLIAICILSVGAAGLFASRRASTLSEDVWVHRLIPEVKRRLRGERLLPWMVGRVRSASWKLARSMVRPRASAIALGVLAFIVGTFLFYMAGEPSESGVSGRYLTLWQLQAGLTSIALPLLIFIIQFGGEELKMRQHKTRALVYMTWVLPILVVLAGFLVAFGIGTHWPGGNAYWMGIVLFSGGVILTMTAFVRLLIVVSHPKRLDEASIELLETLFDEQMESALDQRIGTNLVKGVLNEYGGHYNPFWSERPGYVAADAPRAGVVRNIHLGRLRTFLKSLPRRGAGVADASADDPSRTADEEREGLGQEAPPKIIWRYNYSDRIPEERQAAVLFREDAFEDLNVRELEIDIAELMKIEQRP